MALPRATRVDTIAERLNTDLQARPPPQPPGGRRARGAWSKSAVGDILKNPKYTGYQVYNRRARRSRGGTGVHNPPEMWVWSPEPAHEPLIPKWMYDELTILRLAKRGSRDGHEPNRHPNTTRSYLLRGRVLCRCGRRMLGHRHRGHTYYRCWPQNNNRGRMDRFTDHPKTVYIREDAILTALTTVFNECLFNPHRVETLLARIPQVDRQRQLDLADRRTRLQKRALELVRKQNNLLKQAENADPDDSFTQALRHRYNTLVTEHHHVLTHIDDLDHQTQTTGAITRQDLAPLDALPHLTLNLHRLPHELQTRLYTLTKLTITIDHTTDHAHIDITLPGDNLDAITTAARAAPAPDEPSARANHATDPQVSPGVIATGAPGAIRTHTGRVLKGPAQPAVTCACTNVDQIPGRNARGHIGAAGPADRWWVHLPAESPCRTRRCSNTCSLNSGHRDLQPSVVCQPFIRWSRVSRQPGGGLLARYEGYLAGVAAGAWLAASHRGLLGGRLTWVDLGLRDRVWDTPVQGRSQSGLPEWAKPSSICRERLSAR
ncbi:recombinase family protein [Actinokineospora sp. UTMC 2448]|uniref:recombinase family protein n=1 Tax=Actinokineospora sp. UTMC 2448 TaxID=2268449 RepID=UPI0021646D58|nr:recombinase family protein [Actinokineospora sp. UTMC 2448]